MTTRYHATGLVNGGANADGSVVVACFETSEGAIEIVLPIAAAVEAAFDWQTILEAAHKAGGRLPPVPADADAARPARSVQILEGQNGDRVIRFTLVDGTSASIRLDKRIVADAVRGLITP